MPFRKNHGTTNDLVDLVAGEDARGYTWYRTLEAIRDLRASGTYRWADATLAGIAETIARTERVTRAQWLAVVEIAETRRSPSRNFDAYGFGRRW